MLTSGTDVGEQELADILDVPVVRSLMEDFTGLTGMVTAILDLKGHILVATGWQDICTRFHRMNPLTARNCTESDLFLVHEVRPGQHVAYKCKNGLWDVVTPLLIGDKYVGNIYSGQFFYDDETVDEGFFVEQARRCGMDEESYLAALRKVPRISREKVTRLMDFLSKFSALISRLGYSNLKLAQSIAEQRRVEEALRESEERFRLLIQRAPVPIAIEGENGNIEYLNDRFLATFGYTREDIPDLETWFERAYPDPQYRREVSAAWREAVSQARRASGDVLPSEYRIICRDGSARVAEIYGTKIGDRFLVLLNDVSERKRAEEQLQQSQKMEAVGRLAGGVAHDFNNLLTVINGYSDLVLDQIEDGDPQQAPLLEIRNAGQRAADLTRQLLAFSRKQLIQPRALNLNDCVRDAGKMLQRLIGEDIELVPVLEPALGTVRADPGQVHQVLMNLAANARDAMPTGGRFVIETQNLDCDGTFAAPREPLAAGRYVSLSVSDTGVGMNEDAQRHVFEPFFTTKEQGKGTGLGLATVFGIVKQSGGYIWLYSEPGYGTTFRICFPRIEDDTEPRDAERCPATELRGDETVLVVEDQAEVLQLVVKVLKGYGYRVLEAADGEAAIRVAENFSEPIHALITDIVMPRMSGWELAERVEALRPGIRVLYMSGYSERAAARPPAFDAAIEYLQKPFTPEQIAGKLRGSLDRR